MSAQEKDIVWMGSSYKDVIAMPEEVQDEIGYALDLAQRGQQADYAKPMKGDLREVIEIVADDDRGKSTFRAAYTTKIGDDVYVLDAFQKKSRKGSATPKADLDRIRLRLRQAKEHHEEQERKARKA